MCVRVRVCVLCSQRVHTAVLNPKAIKMGELYGEYNLLTNEWSDGLGSSLIRAAVGDIRPDCHWVVFDGPVDAVWVENMNTGERWELCTCMETHAQTHVRSSHA